MALSDIFNGSDYTTQRINDFVLGVSYPNPSGYTTAYNYDFLARLLTVRTSSSDGGTVVKPFSELDPEGLATLRAQLVALGGKPPELAPAAESARGPSAPRGLNP